MRVGLKLLTPLLLVSCASSWDLVSEIEICDARLYYYDADGDGWGEPGMEPREQCEPDYDTGYTALNGRDCNDDDPDITGRIGTLCPADLVPGGTEYLGFLGSTHEMVVVHGADTDTLWSTEAHHACSPWGWGGSLASLIGSELVDIREALEDVPVWAGFVGAVPDGDGGWAWKDGGELPSGAFQPCGSDLPDSTDLDASEQWLALVKRGPNDWCLGRPQDALKNVEAEDEVPDYGPNRAHLVCKRDRPDPDDWDF